MAPLVEKVSAPVGVGEAPHWDAATQTLYYVDAAGAAVHRCSPSTGRQTQVKLGANASLVVPVSGKKNVFVVTQGRQVCLMTWDGETLTPGHLDTLTAVDDHAKDNVINDGKADSTGRLWAGTMGPGVGGPQFAERQGCLFSLDAVSKAVTTHAADVSISNGIAWSADGKLMYYIDSLTARVDAFDFDALQGTVSKRRTVFDFPANKVEGFPDGMTSDSEGKLWVACFGGAQVVRINPATGSLLARVAIPALQATSVAFGGADLDELYVTTAAWNLDAAQKIKYPDAGAVFKVTGLGVRGVEAAAVRM